MFARIAQSLLGSANDRFMKRLAQEVEKINALEPEVEALSDEALKARTDWLRERIAGGESLDDVMNDAFATVREAAKRTLGQRHYDVQLMGGMVLHRGMIAEMDTGEGKTLTATLAASTAALAGTPVKQIREMLDEHRQFLAFDPPLVDAGATLGGMVKYDKRW